jgi:hypothetical protein
MKEAHLQGGVRGPGVGGRQGAQEHEQDGHRRAQDHTLKRSAAHAQLKAVLERHEMPSVPSA